MFGERIIYFRMAGNRLFLAGGGVKVDVMAGTMTQQLTAFPG